jgi:hypothetical protein
MQIGTTVVRLLWFLQEFCESIYSESNHFQGWIGHFFHAKYFLTCLRDTSPRTDTTADEDTHE